MAKKPDNKKRVIVDYKNITDDLMHLLTDKYPEGYEDDTIIFTNAKGERVEAVELETEDTKYLVKVSAQLTKKVQVYIDEQEEILDDVIEEAPLVAAKEVADEDDDLDDDSEMDDDEADVEEDSADDEDDEDDI
jgi:hypothetical protein